MDNDEIKVGEYARTDNGLIIKVDFIDYNDLCVGTKGVTYDFEDIEEMNNFIKTVKHSSNIIDLIECGDYVNGYEVVFIYGYDEDGNDKDELGICETDEDCTYYEYLENIDIKTIVTKEQFQSVEFRLEE